MAISKQHSSISINLNCYVIRFKQKNTPHSAIIKVNDALGNSSFEQKMQRMISFFDSAFQNKLEDRVLYIHHLDPDYKNNVLNGLFRKGTNGQESYVDQLNKNGKQKKISTVATIDINKYNSTHFFFSICQPSEESEGLLFLAQSYKQFGFKELFEEAFNEFLKIENSGVVCYITQLSVPSLFDQLLDTGSVTNLIFRRHGLSKEFENSFSNEDKKNQYEVNLSVKAKKGSFLGFQQTLKSFKNSETSIMEIFPLENFEYDDLSAEVMLGGKKRVFNMKKPTDFGTFYDLSDVVEIDSKTKHPIYESIKDEAYKITFDEILPNTSI